MKLDNTYRVLPENGKIRLAVVNAGGSYRLAVGAAADWLSSYSPNPGPAEPDLGINDVNLAEAGKVGGTPEGPSIWFELNSQIAMYLCVPILDALGIPSNAYVRDSDDIEVFGGFPEGRPPQPSDFAGMPAIGDMAMWHWFLSYPDETNPSVSELAVAVNFNNASIPMADRTITLPIFKATGTTVSEGYGKASKIVDICFALAKLASMARIQADDLSSCMSVLFIPTTEESGKVAVTARLTRVYNRIGSGDMGEVYSDITPVALFVRLCDLLIGGIRYPHRKHMLPFFPTLELLFGNDELAGQDIRIDDPSSNVLIPTTITGNTDATYLSQLTTSGLFVPPGTRLNGQHGMYPSCAWCLQPMLVNTPDYLPTGSLHHWWKSQGYPSSDGPWTLLFTSIRTAAALTASRLLINTDYQRFHTTWDSSSILTAIAEAKSELMLDVEQEGQSTRSKCDSVESSIGDKISTSEASLHQDLTGQLNSVHTQIGNEADRLASGLESTSSNVTESAASTRATVETATAGLHQNITNRANDILAAIAAIPEGEDTAGKLSELASRQQTDTGVVAAICLTALRKLLSPKRFNQVINQLSNIEYRPVRSLRPGEDVTAGETGPLSPYLDIFDKFGRPRSESNQ